jgi:pyruvate dehydrogenase E2 component (dihydrolipoamide acetyltransferase)
MAQIIGLPKLSPTMEEGVLVRWTKKEGDKVSPGDLVAEVETDKANMDFNIEDEGTLLKLLVKEGETVKLGAPVAIIGKPGEDVADLMEKAKSEGAPAPKAEKKEAKPEKKPEKEEKPAEKKEAKPEKEDKKPAKPEKEDKKPEPKKADGKTNGGGKGQVLASPLAKSLAIELGIDLRQVQGSGPGGRIVERDVRGAADGHETHHGGNGHADDHEDEEEETTQAKGDKEETAIAVRLPRQIPAGEDDYEDIPASNMRRRIAARLTEAKRDVPHFYLMRKLDAAPLLAYRTRLNELLGDRGKISVNDLIIKAVALALRRVPECNASWEGEAIRRYNRVHIGVAVAIDEGLVTPVVRDADQKGIGAIAAEVRDLAERAKSKKLKSHEITGSTFTVSNLGMFGIERFTAIINPPEGGILAVGTTVDEPIVQGDQIVPGKRMTVTMSCDHRVIDGALGAKWLQAFAELFEKPESLAL